MNQWIAKRRRRSGQGMTEYLVILGLIALLLIAAVRYFALAVDEAIEGTVLAWERHADPNDEENKGTSRQVGFTKEEPHDPVFLVSEGPNREGKYEWVRRRGSRTGDVYDGDVISKNAVDMMPD